MTELQQSKNFEQEREIVVQKLRRFTASLLVFFIKNKSCDLTIVRQELDNISQHLAILLEQIEVRQQRISYIEENDFSELISTVLEEVDSIIAESSNKSTSPPIEEEIRMNSKVLSNSKKSLSMVKDNIEVSAKANNPQDMLQTLRAAKNTKIPPLKANLGLFEI